MIKMIKFEKLMKMKDVKTAIGEKIDLKSEFKDIYLHKCGFENEEKVLKVDGT